MRKAETTITIKRGARDDRVPALVHGRFAVNVATGDSIYRYPSDAWFTVSHVATGYAVAELPGRRNAIMLARALDKVVSADDVGVADVIDRTPKYVAFVAIVIPLVQAAIEKVTATR